MNVAAGLAIGQETQVLQSLDGFLSRDYWKPGQIARPLCREMRAFSPLVPVRVVNLQSAVIYITYSYMLHGV